MTFDQEFKTALKLLPDTEKDKLILRLLKHDVSLTNRLYFELVETETAEEKREQLKSKISKFIELWKGEHYATMHIYFDAKSISGMISEHLYTTKDKYGEISLSLHLILGIMEGNNYKIGGLIHGYNYKLYIYVYAKLFKILMLIQKQHIDLHIEFKQDIESIGEYIGNNPHLMKLAINNGLDVSWLTLFSIPTNLNDIYKDIRDSGFLR
ncbi:MAG: hypothetical protein ACK455_02530 [Bacteroidota bacterium]